MLLDLVVDEELHCVAGVHVDRHKGAQGGARELRELATHELDDVHELLRALLGVLLEALRTRSLDAALDLTEQRSGKRGQSE